MIGKFSAFSLPQTKGLYENTPVSQLERLGWKSYFSKQLDDTPNFQNSVARVVEVHRSGLHVIGDDFAGMVPPRSDATVGDWILVDKEQPQNSTVLNRKSVIKRRAAGHDVQVQLIAANIDTAFIVTSCNQDFNVARLERYIALAFEADIEPVIILTKADLCEDSDDFVKRASEIAKNVSVVTLDARTDQPNTLLAQWCKPGKTVAFLGSSGVGKSTLTNALSGSQSIETQEVREGDGKGRHTTTTRQLHFVPGGFAVLDTPGMRELQLTDVASGIGELFADIQDLVTQCRFNDCKHDSEPGCAIRSALEEGTIDSDRLGRWRKLLAEESFNTESLVKRKIKDKAFGKMVRKVAKHKSRRRKNS